MNRTHYITGKDKDVFMTVSPFAETAIHAQSTILFHVNGTVLITVIYAPIFIIYIDCAIKKPNN